MRAAAFAYFVCIANNLNKLSLWKGNILNVLCGLFGNLSADYL
jgi:hypothetical protein